MRQPFVWMKMELHGSLISYNLPQKINLTLILIFLSSFTLFSQNDVLLSGSIIDNENLPLSYVNIVILKEIDSSFVAGTISDEKGLFQIENVNPGNYFIECSFLGYKTSFEDLYIATLSEYLTLKPRKLEPEINQLDEITVTSERSKISSNLDRKTYDLEQNLSQSGGSVLQVMRNLPGITMQDGKVELRGNDKVAIFIDGRQSALAGSDGNSGLDNIPASAIEKIEIINNPSAKYDANGNAGIINIIYKKGETAGLNGQVGITGGLGSLWMRRGSLPGTEKQYQITPKVNPNLSLNYKKGQFNTYFSGDYLYTEALYKNEFVTRNYNDGRTIYHQLQRNRNTHFTTLKGGVDWQQSEKNVLGFSALYGSEKIIDHGDQPFFNGSNNEEIRRWKFLEDELKTTILTSLTFQHKFTNPGQVLEAGVFYTFHREDEKYFYDNILSQTIGTDAFKLLSDEEIYDFKIDYKQPLQYGGMEVGLSLRKRDIPTNMLFIPGDFSVLDADAGGEATYRELIPAVYGNYIFETRKWEMEAGLRLEYLNVDYFVNPGHPTYESDGYNYSQPFPNIRLAYKVNERNKFVGFFNRRVDRPGEVDIRIFPKYDDAEIIKVGNPELQAQFTNSFEVGYKTFWDAGSLYSAIYHKASDGTITRISTSVPGSDLIYAIFHNVNKSYNTGTEIVLAHRFSNHFSFNANATMYRNQIDPFTITNKYPEPHTFTSDLQTAFSGNLKLNGVFNLKSGVDMQVSAIYLAPDIIPQGKVNSRFSLDFGVKKVIQKGNGELFINAIDLLSTMALRKEIVGNNFLYKSEDFYETQVVRLGYRYRFKS